MLKAVSNQGNSGGGGAGGVVASGTVLDQSGATTLVTYAVPASGGQYRLGAWLYILRAVAGSTVSISASFTDESGTSQTVDFYAPNATSPGFGGVGNFNIISSMDIIAQGSSTITIFTTITFGPQYDAGASIQNVTLM